MLPNCARTVFFLEYERLLTSLVDRRDARTDDPFEAEAHRAMAGPYIAPAELPK
jgi:hypothetical protein